MRALSFEGGASRLRRSVLRAGVLAAAVSCGCGNVVTVDEAGGSTGTSSDGGGGATTTMGEGGATTTMGEGGATMTGEGGAGLGGTGTTTTPGCTGDADCAGDPKGPLCDPATGECAACLVDTDCPFGTICAESQCLPGCSQVQACEPGLSCCGSECHNLLDEVDHCGACNSFCPSLPWMTVGCKNAQCVALGCEQGHADCDGEIYNGCEHSLLIDGPCACVPGEKQVCYLGAPATEGVGPCKAGTRTCDFNGVSWGPCLGQVLPAPEICANGVDEDCDGAIDENVDADLDGWGTCEGDCNDADPKVNPGAIEINYVLVDDDNNVWTPPIKVYSGNGKDDDCDPATPDVGEAPPCASSAKLTGVTAADLAAAMELCRTTAASPPKPQKTWGVVSAQLLRADGSAPGAAQLADMMDKQTAVLSGYGVSAPKIGATMVGLSTGMMRDQDDPGAAPPSPGTDLGWTGSPPADYLSANFGALPSNNGCSGACPSGTGANDGVLLRLVIRVPTNMGAFSFDYRAFTAGYPAAVCSTENDFFLARLSSAVPGIPVDKNIVFDPLSNPVSMNNVFFEVCAPAGCFTCPKGAGDLAGTGMSAATSWLVTDAPVLPGETITLDLTVFDVSTGTGDWVALVDGFRWHQPMGPGPFP